MVIVSIPAAYAITSYDTLTSVSFLAYTSNSYMTGKHMTGRDGVLFDEFAGARKL